MNIEVSSDNHILGRPQVDLNLQRPQVPNGATGILSATSSKGEMPDDSTLSARTTVSALPDVDSKSTPRRRNRLRRHENAKSEMAAVNSADNLAEAAAENLESQSSLAGDSGNADDEAALAKQISQLWFSVEFKRLGIRKSRQEIAACQVDLSRELHRYKGLLVGSGRSGKWSAFLRRIEMSRATADRYVQRWECSLMPVNENRLSEAISPPTAEELTRMVNRITPKLLRILTTGEAVEQFMAALGAALQVPHSN